MYKILLKPSSSWCQRFVNILNTISTLFIYLMLSLSSIASAESNSTNNVYWAGFSYTGTYASRDIVSKYTSLVIEKNSIEALNKAFGQSLTNMPPANFNVISDKLASLDGSTSNVVLAAAMDREVISIEPIAGRYKLLVEIYMQALFFDYKEKQVIASYPIAIRRVDLFAQRPTEAEVLSAVEGILYGSVNNMTDIFFSTISSIKIPDASLRRLQVGEVIISDDVKSTLPENLPPEIFASSIASEFTKIISSNTGIGLLPPALGEAIGKTMALRFNDQRVFQLKIPDPDYVVGLRIDRFASRTLEETPAMKKLLFGAVFSISVKEPLSGNMYFDQPLRKGEIKIVPASQDYVDIWAASYETLISGLGAFSNAAAGQADNKWIDGQQPGGRQLNKQLTLIQELLEKCK